MNKQSPVTGNNSALSGVYHININGKRKHHMRSLVLALLLGASTVLTATCNPTGASVEHEAAANDSSATLAVMTGFPNCPVTQPPQPAFTPPSPWPSLPPENQKFWFGNAGLWTMLPFSGSWRQLAISEKFWWWSEEFDVDEDETPDLKVTARRLDGTAPIFQESKAVNGYAETYHWAMLSGVKLPSPGCWEFTGLSKDHQLTFVLWVPSE
jgi:hypothetical protein